MSKKQNVASHKKAAKRNVRAKAKRETIARGKNTPSAVQQRKMRGVFGTGTGDINFDTVLENAVRQVNKGNKSSDTAFNSTEEMVGGIKNAASEVFKMYSYLTLVAFMIEKKVIEHEFKIDLDKVSLDLMAMDNQVSRLVAMIGTVGVDEGAILTESLDIGTTLQNQADILYAEISAVEQHSLVIEETISRLATEVEEADPSKARFKVLETLAYKKLAEIEFAARPAANVEAAPVV